MTKKDMDSHDREGNGERYVLESRDQRIIEAAKLLLRKIAGAPFASPAQLVGAAKALRALERLPRVTHDVWVTVSLTAPSRQFGEHTIMHGWTLTVEPDIIEITSGGYFNRPCTGGDSFTCMHWMAQAGSETEYANYLDELAIVDDAREFDQEIAELDLKKPGYSLEVSDEDYSEIRQGGGADEENLSDSVEASAQPQVSGIGLFADECDGKQNREIEEFVQALLTLVTSNARNCPLMKHVLERYGRAEDKKSNAIGKQLRAFDFYLWCARRVIFSYCQDFHAYHQLLSCYDLHLMGAQHSMFEQAFATFDEAIKREDGPGWAYWLGAAVLHYINEGPFDRGQDPFGSMMAVRLPAQALTLIHEASKPLLWRYLGINV
ncbi:MAG: hypothetical protein NTX87_09285 [Planctomycetota bacterium]|nr:hypothetical protein [Planctomycetota bacterium]